MLLLACINFINLSTARSEKRAREVGVRKTVGSARLQLVFQFLSESFVVVTFAFVTSIVLLSMLQGWFNELSDKDIALPFDNGIFWMIALAFIVVTGCLAGIYPAFYLSSFQPVKVLKGVARLGRYAALPRKVLVIVQFTVSVVLIIGTLIVYQQIEFARNRPIGYNRESLITLEMSNPNYAGKLDVLRTELLRSGAVSAVSSSSSPLTAVHNIVSGFAWQGKDPAADVEFAICKVTSDFGKTAGWEIVAGRDFSGELSSDSTEAVIINEAAVKYMGLENPIGQGITDLDEFGRKKWTRIIVGVIKDMVMESPYAPVRQTLYYYDDDPTTWLHIKMTPELSASAALPRIEAVIKNVVPSALFDYKFVDDLYAQKFSQEQRIGKLSGIFSGLAIFISCLGLFGLASFVAEQRTKEIGIRKIMGASVSNLWRLLSRDFVGLVVISCLFAVPIGYYFMSSWLEKYEYRTEISWWIFILTCAGALVITLLTVSYQAIAVALMNPLKNLRSE